jgi:hypothetical protein
VSHNGEYILLYPDRRECHGKDLMGGVLGQLQPLSPDLNLVKAWKFEEFVATLRNGFGPTDMKSPIRCPRSRSEEWVAKNCAPSTNI